MDDILIFFAKIVLYFGGSVAIAAGVFVFFGKKWIETWFSKELMDAKYKIDSLFSRVTKIHDKEFEVLPKAWAVLCEAINQLTRFTSLYKEFPDLNRMGEQMFEEYINNSTMHEYEKNEIRQEKDRIAYYQNWIFYREMIDARNAIAEFHAYIQKNSIFLNQELKDKFGEIDKIMWSSYVSMDVGHESKDYKMKVEAFKKVQDEVEPIKNSIEELLQKRLRYNEAE